MAAELAAVRVDDRAGAVLCRCLALDEARVVAVGHEADLLALGLVGDGQPALPGDGADARLVEPADGEEGGLELRLGEAEEEVGLVLGAVRALQQAESARRAARSFRA